MGALRWVAAGLWGLACAGQLVTAFLVRPRRMAEGWPTGGGQATPASLLLADLAVLVVLLAPVLIPGLLRLWSAPLAAWGCGNGSGRSPRELDIVRLIAEGMSNEEIVDRLVLQPASVRRNVSRTLTKLHLRDCVQIVVAWYKSVEWPESTRSPA